MQGNRFSVSVHIHGTLAANARGEFAVPCNCALEAVSLCNSANSDMTLTVGKTGDADAALAAKTGGDSGTPTLFTPADWNGSGAVVGVPMPLTRGEMIDWDIDYDGSAGTASANVALVFYFLEG